MSLLSSALDLLYPRVCSVCGGHVDDPEGHLCWSCRGRMPLVARPFCEVCGDPVEGDVEGVYHCTTCRQRRPCFDMARSAARYRGGIKEMIHAFKYEGAGFLSADLAPLLYGCVEAWYRAIVFDAVAFVPLYPKKERTRTYNQAQLLANDLSRNLGVPVFSKCLRRIRSIPSQTGLSAAQRRRNVKGAFLASQPDWIEGRMFLLVDDVMTTGATANECAGVLKKNGASGVHVVTVARG